MSLTEEESIGYKKAYAEFEAQKKVVLCHKCPLQLICPHAEPRLSLEIEMTHFYHDWFLREIPKFYEDEALIKRIDELNTKTVNCPLYPLKMICNGENLEGT